MIRPYWWISDAKAVRFSDFWIQFDSIFLLLLENKLFTNVDCETQETWHYQFLAIDVGMPSTDRAIGAKALRNSKFIRVFTL